MSQHIKNLVVFLSAFIVGILLTVWFQKKFVKPKVVIKTEIQIDTLRDTILVDSPIPIIKRVVDTMYVPVYPDDLIAQTDTVYISLPRTQKVYQDSTYRAVVSGYEPSLDSLRIFRQTIYKTITNTVEVPAKHKRNFVELESGFMYDKTMLLPVTLDIGYRKGIFEASAGGGYDFLQHSPVVKADVRLRLEF